MRASNAIHFIFTGGTIDSHYEGAKDTAVPNRHSVIPGYLKTLKLYAKLKFTEVCMKDSRALTARDREKILDAVEGSPCGMVVITHGTYTMPDTARYLGKNLKRKDQKVVLTGSMIPLEGFAFTDAPFNLGYAMANVQNIKSGVYICMNGTLFSTEEVAKDLFEGKFYSVFKEKQ